MKVTKNEDKINIENTSCEINPSVTASESKIISSAPREFIAKETILDSLTFKPEYNEHI